MSCQPHCFPEGVFLSCHDLVRPVDWAGQFGNDRPLHLEIGFGFGEFLIDQLQRGGEENFVGIEQDWSRMTRCLARVGDFREFCGDREFGKNLRLLRIDATVALQRLFRPCSIGRVTCLFPCPWPKKTHIKHRLFSRDFLCLLNSRLKQGAVVKVVTDWRPYLEWMSENVADSGFLADVQKISARFNTKFERKWRAAGQEEFWELTLTKADHRDLPVWEDVALRVFFAKDFSPTRFQFENIIGKTSVIYKDFIFDQGQNAGLVRLVVAEPFLTQHVWVGITKTPDRWCVAKADGHSALPTEGVALAIERVYQAVCQSAVA